MVALVTGGASGLGRGTVDRLVKQGARVVIGDLPASKGKSVADELGETNVLFAPMDVRVTLFLVFFSLGRWPSIESSSPRSVVSFVCFR